MTGASIAAEVGRRICAHPGEGVAHYRRLRRELSRELEGESAGAVIGAACALARDPRDWRRFIAYELVQGHPAAAGALDSRRLARLGRGMASWAQVDCFSICLSGPAWKRGAIADGVVHGWARSPDVWWRRAALVSTVPLNGRAHGGAGDARRTLRVCRMLEGDRDPMVVKALSWALRELAKRDPVSVRTFLAGRGDSLAPLVRREVRNKLETGLKNPGRRGAAGRGPTSLP
jgi:hypothetical protein